MRAVLPVLLLASVLPAGTAGAETFYRYPLDHLGYYAEETVADAPQLVGRFGLINVGIHTAAKASPVVDNGIIYVGADSGMFYAINDADLTLRWSFAVRKTAEEGIHATAAVDEDKVIIGDYAGWLYALDKQTGRLLWQTELGESIGASPVIWNDRICVGVETTDPDGYLSCVDRETGERLFDSPTFGEHTHSTPTVDEETGSIYIGANNHIFYSLDGNTGRILWSLHTGGEIKSTAALIEDRVLFTSWDHQLRAVDRRTGAVEWAFSAGDISMSSPAVDPEARLVYFGSHDGFLYAVDLDDGTERWRFQTADAVISSPIVVSREPEGKMVIVGSDDSFIYGVDAATGALIWSYETQGYVTSGPTVKDGKIYVSGDDGWLYVLQ